MAAITGTSPRLTLMMQIKEGLFLQALFCFIPKILSTPLL